MLDGRTEKNRWVNEQANLNRKIKGRIIGKKKDI